MSDGQIVNFALQLKGKKGKITAGMISPSGKTIDCNITETESGQYSVKFDPVEDGEYTINVYLDGKIIPGTKFKITVGGGEVDASKVVVSGPGLIGGLLNKPSEFIVNASNAGSGEFSFSIEGPGNVKLNCEDQEDGTYKVVYTPEVAGTFEIGIRYGGEHIPGSAFKVQVVNTAEELMLIGGDATKCIPKGNGLHEAHVGKHASFTVDASNAGKGGVLVGIEGPVTPAEEIVVKHTGSRKYYVNYKLKTDGDYKLQVLWAGKHVPGSPFPIKVC